MLAGMTSPTIGITIRTTADINEGLSKHFKTGTQLMYLVLEYAELYNFEVVILKLKCLILTMNVLFRAIILKH